MNTNLSSAQLKSIAKGQLIGKYGTAISAFLAAEAVLLIATALSSLVVDTTTTVGMIIYYLVSFILQLIGGIFNLGIARFYLNLACGQQYSVTDVFSGFRSHADKAIAVKFFVLIFQIICFIPAIICFIIYGFSESPVVFLITCMVTVISGALGVYISLLYSQVFYVMLDFPDYSVRKLLQVSRQVIKGHKGRLFYMNVSFLPFTLLGIFSCCIAYLWIVPYMNATFANFYLDLMRPKASPESDKSDDYMGFTV